MHNLTFLSVWTWWPAAGQRALQTKARDMNRKVRRLLFHSPFIHHLIVLWLQVKKILKNYVKVRPQNIKPVPWAQIQPSWPQFMYLHLSFSSFHHISESDEWSTRLLPLDECCKSTCYTVWPPRRFVTQSHLGSGPSKLGRLFSRNTWHLIWWTICLSVSIKG